MSGGNQIVSGWFGCIFGITDLSLNRISITKIANIIKGAFYFMVSYESIEYLKFRNINTKPLT